MKLSLGYIKDILAFTTSIICIIIFYIYKITPPKIVLPIFIGLVFLFDGLFTIFPNLHNYYIDNI